MMTDDIVNVTKDLVDVTTIEQISAVNLTTLRVVELNAAPEAKPWISLEFETATGTIATSISLPFMP